MRCERCGESLACEIEHLCEVGERVIVLCGECGREAIEQGEPCEAVRE